MFAKNVKEGGSNLDSVYFIDLEPNIKYLTQQYVTFFFT